MKKIRVSVLNHHNNKPEDALYKFTEVTDETYTIIERKVIENATKNVELQIFLQTTNITLPKLMETCITEQIVNDAIIESINNLKQKK